MNYTDPETTADALDDLRDFLDEETAFEHEWEETHLDGAIVHYRPTKLDWVIEEYPGSCCISYRVCSARLGSFSGESGTLYARCERVGVHDTLYLAIAFVESQGAC